MAVPRARTTAIQISYRLRASRLPSSSSVVEEAETAAASLSATTAMTPRTRAANLLANRRTTGISTRSRIKDITEEIRDTTRTAKSRQAEVIQTATSTLHSSQTTTTAVRVTNQIREELLASTLVAASGGNTSAKESTRSLTPDPSTVLSLCQSRSPTSSKPSCHRAETTSRSSGQAELTSSVLTAA